MLKIFVLASGRSGTKYLSDLFKYNIKNCISKHEPLPNMFGKPIYWRQQEKIDKIRRKFLWKKKKIDRYAKHGNDVYIETNNAFLKSFSDVAMEYYPDMKLIHLIRNPLEVARSELNKDTWIHTTKIKILYPFPKYYRGKDRAKYYIWTLTKKEDIYRDVQLKSLTPYQNYLLQWIEIENRAMQFLEEYKKYDDCYTLFTPGYLNNYKKIEDMFNFFNLTLNNKKVNMTGDKNISIIPTAFSKYDEIQFQKLIENLPNKYLEIFKKKPYTEIEWSRLFR